MTFTKWVFLNFMPTTWVILASINPLYAQTEHLNADNREIKIPFQGDLIDRLEKVGLQPSITTRVEPPKGWQLPEIPKKITRNTLNPAEQIKLSGIENKRQEGKLTETEHLIEKDTIFRDSNFQY